MAALAAAVLAAVALLPSLSAGFVEPGDRFLLLDHDRWHGFGDGRLGWMLGTDRGGASRPLAWLSLALDHEMAGGADPSVVHRTALILHAAAAALLAALAVRIARLSTGEGALPRSVALAGGLAAAIWAVHPLRAEAVSWASARGEALAAPLLLAGALWGLRGVSGPRIRPLACLLSMAFYGLALASDPATAAGWAGAGLALLAWLRSRCPDSAAARLRPPELAATVLLLAGPALIAFAGAAAASGPGARTGLAGVLGACEGAVRCVRSTLWPAGLHPAYDPAPGFPAETGPELWVGGATVAVAAALALRLARGGRGAGWSVLAFLALALPPALALPEPVGADRIAHAATLPLFAAGAAVLLAPSGRPRLTPVVLGIVLVGILLPLGRRQAAIWTDTGTLLAHTLGADPTNETALALRGEIARREGEPLELVVSFHTASLAHDEARPLAHAYLGRALLDKGDAEARAHLERAVVLGPWLPGPHRDLGALLLRRGATADAAAHLEEAVRLDPLSPAAWHALGRALALAGKREAAVRALEESLRLAPGDPAVIEALRRAR